MQATASTFLDFNLPNATTWFYFSFLLAVALYFKFGRFFSIRNWDVVTLFLLVPGLLLIQSAQPEQTPAAQHPAVHVAGAVGQAALPVPPVVVATDVALLARRQAPLLQGRLWTWFGYLWLLCGSGYFFLRCLFDLALVRRPALSANLTVGGLAWLAGALLVCLSAVAFRQVERAAPGVKASPAAASAPAPAPPGPESAALALTRHWLQLPRWAVAAAAVLCHLAVVLGLVVLGARHFQDVSAGMAAATFYLMLPYTGLHIGHVQQAAPVALLLAAVAAYRRPTLAGALLGLAAALSYFPALVMPAWLSFYRGRGAGRFLIAFLLVAALGLGSLALALQAEGQLDAVVRHTLAQAAWQPWKVPAADAEGFWAGIHWAYRIPVFIAYLAFVIATLFWPVPKNLAHLLALSAAILVGLQFWYADRGGAHVLWYLPLLLLLVFRPNLQDRLAPPIVPETDWLCRLGAALRRAVRWLARVPEPAQPQGGPR